MVSTAQTADASAAPKLRRWGRTRSTLAAWLALSVLLHGIVMFAWPGAIREPGASKVQVLDVVLLPQSETRTDAPAPPPGTAVKGRQTTPVPSRAAARPRRAAPKRQASPEPVGQAQAPPEPIAGESPATGPPAQARATAVGARRAAGVSAAPAAAGAAPTVPVASAASATRGAGPRVTPPMFNAAYLQNPPPRYPLIARRRGEEGTVTLRVHVRRDGVPASVALEKSSGSEALDTAALDAVRQWRFAPARRGGERVDAWVLVPIVFRLEGTS